MRYYRNVSMVRFKARGSLDLGLTPKPRTEGSSPSVPDKSDSSIDIIVSIEVSSFYRQIIARTLVFKPKIKTSVAVRGHILMLSLIRNAFLL